MDSRRGRGLELRGYQRMVVEAVLASVARGDGLTFTVLFPRQSGKNELSAQLEVFLLRRHSRDGGSLVKAAPTFRPQLLTSLRRLETALERSRSRGRWRRRGGYLVELGAATCSFFSAQPGANVVGATASLLLEGDEAQDIEADKWDRDLLPMCATANATRVLYGTPWTDRTLLAREIERNLALERRDGLQRHFTVGWEEVAEIVPAYGRHVEGEIARLGASHPIVRTQYLLEALSRADRFFDARHLEKLQGEHSALDGPSERPAAWGKGSFVAGIDVAGEDEEDPEGLLLRVNPRRDSTVLTIAFAEERLVERASSELTAWWDKHPLLSLHGRPADASDPLPPGEGGGDGAEPRLAEEAGYGTSGVIEPRLQVVRQYAWRGTPHRQLYPLILALVAQTWRCRTVVVDATGVGSGLAAFLGAALGPRVVVPYRYTAASKSKLGYDLLGAVNGGRVKMHADSAAGGRRTASGAGRGGEVDEVRREFFGQAEAAAYELRAGQVLRWGVPEGAGHDDLLNALALCVQAGPLGAYRVARGRVAGR